MPTYRLDLAWDGTPFCGWQRQTNQDSIQARIEDALTRLFGGEKIKVQAAGRTDAGVHALQQIVSFTAQGARNDDQILRALNAMLPDQIVCLRAQQMEEGFHARTVSKEKMYRYRILYSKLPCPFRYQYTWHIRYSLKLERMEKAAQYFEGTHDFSAFRSQGCSAQTTIRTISSSQLKIKEDELHFEVVGKGFLRHQVRIMMGTLVEIGLEKREPEAILDLLREKDRDQSGQTAPSHGLWLIWTSLLDRTPKIE